MSVDEIDRKLKEWFNSTGFPLEIECARAFSRATFAVEHSAAYVDPETEKGREIDLLAYERDATGCFNIVFAVECKSSDKPWVVLTNRDQYTRYGGLQIASYSRSAREALGQHVGEFVKAYRDVFGEFSGGYSLKQAFAGKTDQAYAASVGASKAASWIAGKDEMGLVYGIPIIVVNAPIFEYSEGPYGEQQFTEVSSSAFEFSSYWKRHQRSIIRVVSRHHLDAFATQCQLLAEQYRVLFQEEIERIARRGI